MDRREVNILLALMAARDGRTVGQVEVEAWFEDIGRWDLPTAREAIHRHYSTTRDFMRPFDLIQHIRAIRRERLDAAGAILPPRELADDPAAEIEWMRRAWEAVAAGRPAPGATNDVLLAGSEHPEITSRIRAIAATKAVPSAASDNASDVRDRPVPSIADDASIAAMETERNRQLAALEAMSQPIEAAS